MGAVGGELAAMDCQFPGVGGRWAAGDGHLAEVAAPNEVLLCLPGGPNRGPGVLSGLRNPTRDGYFMLYFTCHEGPVEAFAEWLVGTVPGGGGSEAKKKFVYLKPTSKFGPL